MTCTHVYLYLHTDIKKDGITESAKAFTGRAGVVDELTMLRYSRCTKTPVTALVFLSPDVVFPLPRIP